MHKWRTKVINWFKSLSMHVLFVIAVNDRTTLYKTKVAQNTSLLLNEPKTMYSATFLSM